MDIELNLSQVAVLEWVRDGCAPDAMPGTAPKVSAAALRSRGLVRTSGHGPSWHAQLTDRGRAYLANPPTAAERRSPSGKPSSSDDASASAPSRPIGRSKTEQLVADVIAAGGRLLLPDETARGGVNYRQRAYSAQQHGKVPHGKRLTVSWTREGFLIELINGATGNEAGADSVPVPERVVRYHRIATQFRDRPGLQNVSRKQLQRVLRIVHAIAEEVERRGHTIACASATVDDQRDRDRSNHGQLVVTINGHEIQIRIWEKGSGNRGLWEREKQHWERDRLSAYGLYRTRPKAYDAGATGDLNAAVIGYSSRQNSWGDRKRWRVEDRLPQLLREVENQAVEAEERRVKREREEAERQREWEEAMESAKRRFVDNYYRSVLFDEVKAWQHADRIRAYCDAVEARHAADVHEQPASAKWLALARAQADQMQRLPSMPAEPRITHEDLKPYLGGLSPYGPQGW